MEMAMKVCTSCNCYWTKAVSFRLPACFKSSNSVLFSSCLQNSWFRKSRFQHGKGKASGREGRPRMRERPGLGMHGSSVSCHSYWKNFAKWNNKVNNWIYERTLCSIKRMQYLIGGPHHGWRLFDIFKKWLVLSLDRVWTKYKMFQQATPSKLQLGLWTS